MLCLRSSWACRFGYSLRHEDKFACVLTDEAVGLILA